MNYPTNETIINRYFKHMISTTSKQSLATRKSALNFFFNNFKYEKHIFDISTETLIDYFDHLNEQDLSLQTKKTKWALLRSFLQFCMEYYRQYKFIVIIPTKTIKWGTNHKPEKTKIIITIEETQKILLWLKKTNFKRYLIFRIFAESGPRKGELISLKYDNVDIEKRFIDVTGKKGRKIYYISRELAKYLSIYINERKNLKSKYSELFLSYHNKPYSNRAFNLMLQNNKGISGICDNAGINKHITVQNFRSSLNTHRKKIGCSNEDRKILLNHKTADVNVNNYLIYDYDDYIRMYDKYNPFKGINI